MRIEACFVASPRNFDSHKFHTFLLYCNVLSHQEGSLILFTMLKDISQSSVRMTFNYMRYGAFY